MTIEQSYFEFLSENITVPGYYVKFPDNVSFPSWRLQRIRGSPTVSHDGDTGMETALLQVSCFAKTYKEVKELAESIKAVCSGYSGLMGSIPARIFIKNETDLYEPDAKLFHVALDMEIVADISQ
jgi:hypothetical protein